MPFNFSELCKGLLTLNFYLAAVVLATFCLSAVSEHYTLFNFNEELYGALDNNLRIMAVYLGLTEIVVFTYCWLMKKFQNMVLMGFFLLLMIESLDFYGEVNTVAIDERFSLFFLYTGLSHVAFGILSIVTSNRVRQQRAEKKPVTYRGSSSKIMLLTMQYRQ